jgi:hypothetical protein
MNSRDAARGMTLIELLLMVSMLSALLAAAGGLVVTVARMPSVAGPAVGPVDQIRQALDRVALDVESAQPLFGVPTQGTATRYEFARVEGGEWRRIQLRFEAGGAGGTALVRESAPWDAAGGPARRETLAVVDRGAFAYARQDPDGRLVWDSVWDGTTDGVPRLVRVTPALVLSPGQEPAVLPRVMRGPAGALPTVEPIP